MRRRCQMFSVNGYHETSMDAVADRRRSPKPMLYLYYGSKGRPVRRLPLNREMSRFIDALRSKHQLRPGAKDLLRNTIDNRSTYIDTQPGVGGS